LVIVEVGPGSQAIRRAREGDAIRFYGPLGTPYPVLPGKRILAIGGGVGLAPLYFYGFRAPGRIGDDYRLLYGARTQEDLFPEHVPLERKGVALATDDGSYGFKGNVVELASAVLREKPADVLFSCGPTVMMRAAQALADRLAITHYMSLEKRMGCAMGACRAFRRERSAMGGVAGTMSTVVRPKRSSLSAHAAARVGQHSVVFAPQKSRRGIDRVGRRGEE
jgi:dihydroorotate dehydrogenase electron transfer subunit